MIIKSSKFIEVNILLLNYLTIINEFKDVECIKPIHDIGVMHNLYAIIIANRISKYITSIKL